MIVSAYQDWLRQNYDVMLIVAGLPVLSTKVTHDKAISYLLRSAHYHFGPLDHQKIADLYHKKMNENQRQISIELANLLAQLTLGYAYMVQLLGAYTWEQGPGTITKETIQYSLKKARTALTERLFSRLEHDLTPADKVFMWHIAKLGGKFTANQLIINYPGKSQPTLAHIRHHIHKLEENGILAKIGWGQYKVVLPFFNEHIIDQGEQWLTPIE